MVEGIKSERRLSLSKRIQVHADGESAGAALRSRGNDAQVGRTVEVFTPGYLTESKLGHILEIVYPPPKARTNGKHLSN